MLSGLGYEVSVLWGNTSESADMVQGEDGLWNWIPKQAELDRLSDEKHALIYLASEKDVQQQEYTYQTERKVTTVRDSYGGEIASVYEPETRSGSYTTYYVRVWGMLFMSPKKGEKPILVYEAQAKWNKDALPDVTESVLKALPARLK